MAKKTILGVDIGYDRLKLALVSGGRVIQTASAAMPANLMKEGHVTSPEAMADLIKETMREARIHASLGAYVLPGELAYVKTVEMPVMTVDQLLYNLPFEFNDYVTGEVKDYAFDYAVLPKKESDEEETEEDGNSNNMGLSH